MKARDGKDPTERPGGRRSVRRRRATLAAALLSLLMLCCLFGAVASAGAAAPGKPTAKAPTGAIATSTPIFTWSKASGAAKYELRVSQGSTLLLTKTGIAKLSWKSGTALPENVDLTWKVRAGSSGGNGAWSKSLTFTIVTGPPAIGKPYQGGLVAYILKLGEPGYVAGQTHGLIAATEDQSTGIRWYNGTNVTTGATGVDLGTGLSNTDLIIDVQGETATSYAAGVARAYRGGGYTDWYLPSASELDRLFASEDAIGGFASADYWSSSEYAAYAAWYRTFGGVNQYGWYGKDKASRVRAIRAF